MSGIFKIITDVDARTKESSFMNETLSALSEVTAISIAVTPQPPEDLDLSDSIAVDTWLRASFAPLVAAGWEVEIQIGPDGYDRNNPLRATTTSSDMTVANTILAQLGGRSFTVMTGAKSLSGDATMLSMRLPTSMTKDRASHCRIALNAKDTYRVETLKMARSPDFSVLTVASADDVTLASRCC